MTRSIKNRLVVILIMLLAVALLATCMAFVGASTSSASTTYFTVNEGAAVKIDRENDAQNNTTGIRFTGTVTKELSTLILADAESDAEVGIAVLPAMIFDAFDARESGDSDDLFTFINAKYGKQTASYAKAYANSVLSTTEDVELSGRIIKILDNNYNFTYQAIMYYTLDGGTNYEYSNLSGERSLIQVANAALAAGAETEDKEPIANIIKKSLSLSEDATLSGNDLSIDLGSVVNGTDLNKALGEKITAEDFAFTVKSGSEYVSLTDGVVNVTAEGSAVIVATAYDGALSFEVNVDAKKPEDGELASFNNTGYESLVSLNTPENKANKSNQAITNVKIHDSLELDGEIEQGVMEIEIFSGSEGGNDLNEQVNLVIGLPEGHSADGYTIKWAFDHPTYSSEIGSVRFSNSDYASSDNYSRDAYVNFSGDTMVTMNTWNTTYVGGSVIGSAGVSAADAIYMQMHGGGKTIRNSFKLYFAWVKEGDQIVIEPEEGELASFNHDKYATMVSLNTPAAKAYGQSITGIKIHDSLELNGVTEYGVMEVEIAAGNENGLGNNEQVNLVIGLLEGHTTAGYTIRWAFDHPTYSSAKGSVRFTNSSYATSDAYTTDVYKNLSGDGMVAMNTWKTTYIAGSSVMGSAGMSSADAIYMQMHGGGGGNANNTFKLYFAWVKEGVPEVEPAEGTLASFDNELYENMVSLATPSGEGTVGESIKYAKYHETYEGEQDVLEVSINSGAHPVAKNINNLLKVQLPKSHTSAGYTIRIMINCDLYTTLLGNWWFAPVNRSPAYVGFTGENAKATGVWHDIYVPANTSSDAIYIAFFATGGAPSGNYVYSYAISFVKEGMVITPKDGEIASFDSDMYEGLVSIATPAGEGRVEEAITSSKYYANYEGEESVLKFTVSSGFDAISALGNINNVIRIQLPKGHSANGYTVRFRIECDYYPYEPCNLWFTSAARSDKYVEFSSANSNTIANNTWHTIYVPRNIADDAIYIALWVPKGGADSAVYSMALSWVAEGDVTNA